MNPNVAAYYRKQVAELAEALVAEENRAEAADLMRSLVDRNELMPSVKSKLDIDLYCDLAGIPASAANKHGPLDESDSSVQQVEMVAGAGFCTCCPGTNLDSRDQ